MTFAQAQQDAALASLNVRAVEVGFGAGGWSPAYVGAADNIKLSGSAASVDANFEVLPADFEVTVNTGANGTSTPANGIQTVATDSTLAITLTPAAGFVIDTVSGCGGTLAGNVYTTAAVRENCTVDASFKAAPVIVTPTQTQAVPSLSEWGVMLLGLLTAGAAALRLRRRD